MLNGNVNKVLYNVCFYCGRHASTWDHIVPRASGGSSMPHNLLRACADCNQMKGHRTTEGFRMTMARLYGAKAFYLEPALGGNLDLRNAEIKATAKKRRNVRPNKRAEEALTNAASTR